MENKILTDISNEVSNETSIRDFCNDKEYSVNQVLYRFNTWTNAKNCAGIDTKSITCPNCGSESEQISNHWNSCGEPELSNRQKSFLIGMILSDGTVNSKGAFTSYSSNKEFLQWFSNELDFMCYPIRLNDSGDDRHKRNIKSGFDVNRSANYKDMYFTSSPVHTFTKSLREWYKDGNKHVPKDLELNKDIVRMWYCGDGGLNWSSKNKCYAEIRPLSFDNSKIDSLFHKLQFDYSVQSDGTICFYSDTNKFLDWIKPIPDGMEYKWENSNRKRYNDIK